MDLVTPGIGLVFWTTIIFLTLLIVLGKIVWKPINKAIQKRSQCIEEKLLGFCYFCHVNYSFGMNPYLVRRAWTR